MENIDYIEDEIRAFTEEGYKSTAVSNKINEISKQQVPCGELNKIYNELKLLPIRNDFKYVEPIDFEQIKLESPKKSHNKIKRNLDDKELYNKIYGGWLGRCVGCLLGKPVENWTKENIKKYLVKTKAYPLNDYFIYLPKEMPVSHNKIWFKGNISKMVRDDDIDYTILGLHSLEENGINLTSENIIRQWLDHLPYNSLYTAEKVAYKNIVNGILPPESGRYNNPYREWIGAQIRADIWGYITAGFPEKAAEYAYKDASVSHIKNGVYGEMFISSIISVSFIENDLEKIIEIGLSEIPEKSRLYEAIRNVIKWSKENRDWIDTWENIIKVYGGYHPVHTINNAAIVVMALLYGNKDFEKSICISVMGGLDTDCNGATVGSIIGVILGGDKLPDKWIKPINDTAESAIFGMSENKISDLSRRTLNILKLITAENKLERGEKNERQ